MSNQIAGYYAHWRMAQGNMKRLDHLVIYEVECTETYTRAMLPKRTFYVDVYNHPDLLSLPAECDWYGIHVCMGSTSQHRSDRTLIRFGATCIAYDTNPVHPSQRGKPVTITGHDGKPCPKPEIDWFKLNKSMVGR